MASTRSSYKTLDNPNGRSSSSTRRSHTDSPRSSSETSLGEFDPLHGIPYANYTPSDDDDFDDSDDDEVNDDKTTLRKSKRRRHKRGHGSESRAFENYLRRPILANWGVTSIPRWLISKRLFFLLIILGLFSMLLMVATGGFWVYKKSRIDGASPPWYPTPLGGTVKRWAKSYEKASAMVQKMTLLEKVNITTGTGWMMGPCVGNTGTALRVGFPSLCLQDGPLGLRFADNITASPAGVTVGATWNKDLMYKRGKMLGFEARLKGVNVLLGPSVGPLGRMPAGGRNWEGFGIDPVLQGVAAAMTITGVQEQGVMATIKHYVANEQEHFRQAWEWGLPDGISSNLDDRTLHELYAWPFADAVKAGVVSVMCSYNQVNNSYACQNSKLINGILKDEMGFQGFVQSDWLAQRSGVASALSGLDMSMPGDGARWADGKPFWGSHLTLAALNGSIPMERLNDMVTRIVASWYQVGQDDKKRWPAPPPKGKGGPNFSSWTNEEFYRLYPGSDVGDSGLVNHYVDVANRGTFSHSALARRIAAEGTVLLRNYDRLLPLNRNGSAQSRDTSVNPRQFDEKLNVGIFGEDAVQAEGGPNNCPDRACNKGTLASGWGSGAVEFPYLVTPEEALTREFRKEYVQVNVSPGNTVEMGNVTKPEDQDLCIVFVSSDGGEGFASWEGIKGDRNDLKLQKEGDKLISDVAGSCGRNRANNRATTSPGKTIVVIHSVGPVILESFIEDRNIGAVLFANLPGQESGNALADVLFGRINPSGHLPFTIAKDVEDYGPSSEVVHYPNAVVPQQNFTEGLLVDYRWFDAMKLAPRFEFGFGMSYTKFNVESIDIKVLTKGKRAAKPPMRPEDETDPPEYDDHRPKPSKALFPVDWRKLKKYIYPYIESEGDVHIDPEPDYKKFPFEEASDAGGGEGGHPALWEDMVQVDAEVINLGERTGQAVIQLYVVFPNDVWEEATATAEEDPEETSHYPGAKRSLIDIDDIPRRRRRTGAREQIVFPPRVLRGFQKVHLRGAISVSSPGASFPHPAENPEAYRDHPPAHIHVHHDNKGGSQLHHRRQNSKDFEEGEGIEEEEAAVIVEEEEATRHSEKQPFPAQEKQANMSMPMEDTTMQVHHQYMQPPMRYETGEKQAVRFRLTRRDLSYWSASHQNWILPEGPFRIEVGFSSRDVRQSGRLF